MNNSSGTLYPLSRTQEILLTGLSKGIFGPREMNLRFGLVLYDWDRSDAQRALDRLYHKHPILRLRIDRRGSSNRQMIDENYCNGDVFDISSLTAEDQDNFITNKTFLPFSILDKHVSDILFRSMIFLLSHNRLVIIIVGHHIVCDHISMGVLRDDLTRFCTTLGDDLDHTSDDLQEPSYFKMIKAPKPEVALTDDVLLKWDRLHREVTFLQEISKTAQFQIKEYFLSETDCAVIDDVVRVSRLTQFGVVIGGLLKAIKDEFSLTGLAAFRTNTSGRDGKNLRTVGYFTKSVPFIIDFSAAGEGLIEIGRSAISSIRQAIEEPLDAPKLMHILSRHPIQIVYNVSGNSSTIDSIESYPIRLPQTNDKGYRFLITIIKKGRRIYFNVNFDAKTFDPETVDRIFSRTKDYLNRSDG